MSGEDRKRLIVQVAKDAFAEQGFRATSVKEIAKAADVSEALIYKHFANKEALYDAVLDNARETALTGWARVESLGPGTEALVVYTYFLIQLIVVSFPWRRINLRTHARLLFRSLVGDNKYAYQHFENLSQDFSDEFIASCFELAEQAGDIIAMPIPPRNRLWLVHHLAMALDLCFLSETAGACYDLSPSELAEQAMFFCLRGIGLTDQAIAKYYDPEKLRSTVRWLQSDQQDT